MANEKISQLPSGSPAQTTDLAIIARSGANYQLTLAQIIALFASAIPFSALITGTNTTATMTVGSGAVLEASGSGEILATNVEAVVEQSTTTISGTVPVTASTPTAWITKTVTMPASGGPFRVLASYGVYYNSGGINNAWVYDGTNQFATSQAAFTSTTFGGQNATALSPATYANSAVVTFTGMIECQANSTVEVGPATGGTQASWLNLVVLPSD